MNDATKQAAKLNLGTTPRGRTIHAFSGSGGRGYPLCNQHRGSRYNGRYLVAYGATGPTCDACKAILEARKG